MTSTPKPDLRRELLAWRRQRKALEMTPYSRIALQWLSGLTEEDIAGFAGWVELQEAAADAGIKRSRAWMQEATRLWMRPLWTRIRDADRRSREREEELATRR